MTESSARPPRRPRYRGTHPRRFEQKYKELNPTAYPDMAPHVRAQGRTPAGSHVPVLFQEVLDLLDPRPGELAADCTLGHGGHALGLLARIEPGGRLFGLDADAAELQRTTERIGRERPGAPFTPVHSHFAGLARIMTTHELPGFDVVLADLGVSSMQIDDPRRGFSYKFDGPLDMRMDVRQKRTAADIVAGHSEADLAFILEEHGNEPHAVRIARRIVAARAGSPVTRTRQLVKLIFEAKRIKPEEWKAQAAADPGALHPAALTFQALRIVVNDEMAQLDHLLRTAPWCLRPGGRIGIIGFHRGEDRRVSTAFREGLESGIYDEISPAPVRASAEERRDNPRSASAVFRWARRSHRAMA